MRKEIPVKSDLRIWLATADFRKVIDAASRSNRIISSLITLTFSDDPLIGWRAIDAVGRCAAHLSETRPEVFRKYLQRLFWMMSDESGTTAPRAPEIIGEIIHSSPKEYADFIPLAISLMNLEPEDKPAFLPGILYALGRIGESAPGTIEDSIEGIENALSEPDPQVRAMAARCLGRIGRHDILHRHPELGKDDGMAQIYEREQIRATTIYRVYSDALRHISSR
jgi:hypothetical protein